MSETPAQKRRRYWASPETHRERSRNYQREHRLAILAKKAAWYAENRELAVARVRAFRAENPNYLRESNARRRLKTAWRAWARTCAANRRALQESP
jgi:hypothetical protein